MQLCDARFAGLVSSGRAIAPKIHSAKRRKDRRGLARDKKSAFEEMLIDVWRQVLIEGAKTVTVVGKKYRVLKTPKKGLRQVDFVFEGGGDSRP